MKDTFSIKLHGLYQEQHLPSHDGLLMLAERTASVLEAEDASYRPPDMSGAPGALLDFTCMNDLPLVAVPDLHARVYFLLNVLDYVPPPGFLNKALDGYSILDALEVGAVRIVCVGDALHAELRARDRWLASWRDFASGVTDGKPMHEEMEEGLTLLSMLMECKCRFPQSFHFLKGNHENIMNKNGGGDFSFRKFAEEGEMVKCFMRDVYGADVLRAISKCEDALPLIAAFPECVVSHAEPQRPYSREELINARADSGTVAGLTWTENGVAEDGSVSAVLRALLGEARAQQAVYLAGHRPVSGAYALRQDGVFIQFHNTEMQNVALVHAASRFDPDKDIRSVVDD